MGVAPWQRWTDTPTAYMREYCFRLAWQTEQAELTVQAEELAAQAEEADPVLKYIRLAKEGKFVRQRAN